MDAVYRMDADQFPRIAQELSVDQRNRRERIATELHAALLVAPPSGIPLSALPALAVKQADALIAQLGVA